MVVGLHDPINKIWSLLWKKTVGIDPEGLERRHIGSRLQKWQWEMVPVPMSLSDPEQYYGTTLCQTLFTVVGTRWVQNEKLFYPFPHRTYRLVRGKHM